MSVPHSSGVHRQDSRRPAAIAGLVALLVAVVAQRASHTAGVVFAFWDAQAHLDIARRLHDSATPGLQMLGTVWLPIPHLLFFPFTLIDRWWWNGLAGGIVGAMAYVATVIACHDLLQRRCTDRRVVWICIALLLLNPSLLYLQTTAMTEPLLLAFLTGAVALLDRWSDSKSSRALLWSGVLFALAVGTRYDGWFAFGLAFLWVLWLAIQARLPVWRVALRFGIPVAVMIALWLGYNAWYYGDPLEFQRGVWSAQSQQAALAAGGLLPTKGNLLLSVSTYLGAMALSVGWLLLPAGVLLLPSLRARHSGGGAAVLLLLAALPFNVLALWGGQSAINLPWGSPEGVMNLRYGVMALPGLAAAVALGADTLAKHRLGSRGTLLALSLVAGGQIALWGVDWPANVGALREGVAIRDGDPRQQHASDWLSEHYDGGRVLVDEAVNLSPRTRIPIRDRVYQWSWEIGQRALTAPEQEVDWVVVDEHHQGGKVGGAIADRSLFTARFDVVFADDGLEIWRRR